MFGYRRGELIGRAMTTLAGWPFEQPERWQQLAADPQGQRSMRVEFDGLRSDGTHFAAAGLLSRFDVAGRNHCLVVLQDVSERKQLERAILQAVNREQYRIGNDLHDGLGQELTGIALMLRGVAGRLSSEYAPILPEIEGITRLVNNAIESTRALARGLSPVNLERGGLQDALEGLAMHAAELYGVQIVCTHRVKTIRPLGAELANHLYRIAQEAVRNAVRHGRARTIRLHLHGARAKVRLTVTDDGTGMPVGRCGCRRHGTEDHAIPRAHTRRRSPLRAGRAAGHAHRVRMSAGTPGTTSPRAPRAPSPADHCSRLIEPAADNTTRINC